MRKRTLNRKWTLRLLVGASAVLAWTFAMPLAGQATDAPARVCDWRGLLLANYRGIQVAFVPIDHFNKATSGQGDDHRVGRFAAAGVLAYTVVVLDGPDLVIQVTGSETVVIDVDANGFVVIIVDGVPTTTNTLASDITSIRIDGDSDSDNNTFDLSAVTAANGFSGLDGNITINGGGGDDVLIGSEFSDRMFGGRGNDELHGGDGNDTLRGQGGNDTCFGDNGNDALIGDVGNDELHGGAGDDFLNGNSGNDVMFGGDDNDQMFGGSGDDTMFGEAGNDKVNGQAGNDNVNGGGDPGDTVLSLMGEIDGMF